MIALEIPDSLASYSLNPCCNGIYLMIHSNTDNIGAGLSLNPCCNGIYLMIVHLLS